MTKPTFITGDVPSATQVNDWMVNSDYVRKTVDESVTSSTAFQNDDALVLAVAANTTYELTMVLRMDGATAGDVNTQIVVPASAFFRGTLVRLHPAAATTNDASIVYVTESQSNICGCLGVGTDTAAYFHGLVIVGATAGNCQLQWAQGTSSASASRVWANSYMKLVRVA